jgi:MarR family 2-MHQ and catechol resistance regulon transcriptional repressor
MARSPDPAAHLDDPHIEAYGMLIEAHNELHNALQRTRDAAAGVPVGWLGVLIRLARTPGEQLRMTVLARDMTMSTSGLTRLVDRMESDGVVERRACPEDRRGMLAVLTDRGREVLASTTPCHVADLELLLGGALESGQLATLTGLLRQVRDHVREVGPAPS